MKEKKNITLLEMRIAYVNMLNEIGDLKNIESYPYEGNKFTTDENWTVKVDFDVVPFAEFEQLNLPTKRRNTFNVSYTINGEQSQYKKTTYKELIKILKTVSDIVKDFVESKNNLEALIFLAANKDQQKLATHTDPQKSALYKLIITKTMSELNPGWKLKEFEIGGSNFNGFILSKIKQHESKT